MRFDTRRGRRRQQLIADYDEVFVAIEDDCVTVIDSLPEGHYCGDWAMYDRPGHIHGAINVPTTTTVDETGRFLPLEVLEALFGRDRDGCKITYCGGGIAASSNTFVLARLGFTDVAAYSLSLQEWTADPANPMVTSMEFDDQ